METITYLSQNWLWMAVYMIISYIITFFFSFQVFQQFGKIYPSKYTNVYIFAAFMSGLAIIIFKLAAIIGLVAAIIKFANQ